jgi:hypothetical protein
MLPAEKNAMSRQPEGVDAPSGSPGGVMRLIGAGLILVLAIIGTLVVLGVTPLDQAGEVTRKALPIAVILAISSAAVALLMRRRR